ncbi:tetratricopeptide repeat protein [Actinoplanes sp. NPDC051861]|uniref:tetratricopeptide repeat protein n=1 Tax=Actinoplanes sp. NPDC051861 TaxID=3155170 RepID=UPI003431046A
MTHWDGIERASWIASVAALAVMLVSTVRLRPLLSRLRKRRAKATADRRAQATDGGCVRAIAGGRVRAIAGGSAHAAAGGRSQGPVVVGRIPQTPTRFQHRRLHDDLADTARPGSVRVLSGLGGAGKTQAAADLARNASGLVVWVTATSRDAIVTAYAEAAHALRLADDHTAPETAAGRFLDWARHAEDWLVVLDNLDAPECAEGWWPPAGGHGRTVVTTRQRWEGGLAVGTFTPDESVAFLKQALGCPVTRRDASALAEALGHLPLALAQAAAFLRERQLDPPAYLRRLRDERQRSGAPAATWAVSIAAADESAPRGLARPVLDLLSVLAPEAVPLEFFSCESAVGYVTLDGETGHDAGDVFEALHNLHRLHLITLNPRIGVVETHSLVQRAVRGNLSDEEVETMAMIAADALIDIWPDVEPSRLREQMLRSNALAVRDHAGTTLIAPATHVLHFRLVRSLAEAGNEEGAAAVLRRLLDEQTRLLDECHPNILTTRKHLADVLAETNPAWSARAYHELLADCERTLGPDHHYTLVARCQVAALQDDPAAAVTALRELLADCRRVLGPEHEVTFGVRSSLAHRLGEAGEVANASLHEAVLADETRLFGADDPRAIATRNNLLCLRDDSVAGYRDLVEVCARVLGPDHPRSLTTRMNLAAAYSDAGDHHAAAELTWELLMDHARIYGEDHFETRVVHSALQLWLSLAAAGERERPTG